MTIELTALQQQRRDTAANWTSANPTLLTGEIGYETDTGKFKIGDGSTVWTGLGYLPIPDSSGLIPISQLLLPLGSASAPALTFTGDANTGVYSPGADSLAITTAGTQRVTVDSSGNVGIGTTSPSFPFTVQSDSGTNAIAVLGRSADDISTTLFYENDGTTQIGRIQARQSYLHIAGTDNTKGIFLDNSGNVGIGETTPAAGLDVKVDTNPVLAIDRGSANTANFNLQYNGTVTGQLSAANGDFQISAAGASTPISFYANGSERMRINNLGNILIGGTTSANSDIVLNADGTAIFDGDVTVHGDAQLNEEGVKIQSGLITAVQTFGSNSVFRGLTTAGGDYNIDLKADGTATFAGNVGIGTSSPQDLLHLSSVSSPTIRIENTDTSVSVGQILGAIEFEGNDASTNANGIRAKIEAEYRGIGAQTNLRVYVAKENVATPYEALDIGTGGIVLSTENSERMRIDSSGNVGIGTTSPDVALMVHDDSGVKIHAKSQNTTAVLEIAGTRSLNAVPVCISRIKSIPENPTGNSDDTSLAFETRSQSAGVVERMRIDSSGNVGIGTTSPDAELHVGGSEPHIDIGPDAANRAKIGFKSNDIYIGTTSGSGQTIFKNNISSTDNPADSGTERMRIDSSGNLGLGTSSPNALLEINSGTAGNEVQRIEGSYSGSGSVVLTNWRRSGGAVAANFQYHDSPIKMSFGTTTSHTLALKTANTDRLTIDNSGNVLIGQSTTATPGDNNNTTGIGLNANGRFYASATADHNLNKTADGVVLAFRSAGVNEGAVSISGTTVTYGGGHLARWSQLLDNADPSEILKGTVMSNLDEMCDWGEEDNEQLNRTKISDIEGDPNVAGVFVSTSFNDEGPSDFYVGMTGDMVIRIAQGTTVARGDLLMSAGDGTAKPQDDDIVRSKTIAKVTSTNVSETYADNSYCVPCVLMAC